MAITVTGTNPTAVTVVSDTITTNTIYNGSKTNDRIYQIADAIVGTVNAGIQVSRWIAAGDNFGRRRHHHGQQRRSVCR